MVVELRQIRATTSKVRALNDASAYYWLFIYPENQ